MNTHTDDLVNALASIKRQLIKFLEFPNLRVVVLTTDEANIILSSLTTANSRIAEARNEALEECATICANNDHIIGHDMFAEAIRALKSK